MATWVGVGNSKRPDSFQAGAEAAQKALESMGQLHPDLVLVFASTRFDQEALLKGVTSATQDAPAKEESSEIIIQTALVS